MIGKCSEEKRKAVIDMRKAGVTIVQVAVLSGARSRELNDKSIGEKYWINSKSRIFPCLSSA